MQDECFWAIMELIWWLRQDEILVSTQLSPKPKYNCCIEYLLDTEDDTIENY